MGSKSPIMHKNEASVLVALGGLKGC